MATRSKNGIYKPKVFTATREPNTVEEALQKEHWKAAMSDELSVLMRNQTRSQVPLPAGRKTIGHKGIFEVKEKPD